MKRKLKKVGDVYYRFGFTGLEDWQRWYPRAEKNSWLPTLMQDTDGRWCHEHDVHTTFGTPEEALNYYCKTEIREVTKTIEQLKLVVKGLRVRRTKSGTKA